MGLYTLIRNFIEETQGIISDERKINSNYLNSLIECSDPATTHRRNPFVRICGIEKELDDTDDAIYNYSLFLKRGGFLRIIYEKGTLPEKLHDLAEKHKKKVLLRETDKLEQHFRTVSNYVYLVCNGEKRLYYGYVITTQKAMDNFDLLFSELLSGTKNYKHS